MFGTYIGNNRMFIGLQVGGRIYSLADDLSLTPDLVHFGYFEPSLTNYVMKNIREGMNVVDVGANIGYFTVLLGYKVGAEGKVTAYEPNEKAYQLLVDNLAINGHTNKTDVKKLGVYSQKDILFFNVSERFQGNSSLKNHSAQYKKDFTVDKQNSIFIDVVALDDEDLGFIDFLKIDTEGGEYHVFKGMENILKNKQVDTVVFELNKSMLQEDTDSFYSLLKDYEKDYGFYLLNINGELIRHNVDSLFTHDFIENIVMKKG